MQKILSNNFVLIIISSVLSLIFLLPQIWHQYPNLLDITETWLYGTSFIDNARNAFTTGDRFWPLFIYQRIVLNNIFKYNNQLYFIFFALVLAVTMYISWLLVNISKNIYLLIIFLVTFLVSPVTVDAYWRLGTAENMFTLLLVLGLYYLFQNRINFAAVFFILLLFSKETAIFYIPMILIYFFIIKKYFSGAILGLTGLAVLIKVFSLANNALNRPESYVALFSPYIQSITEMSVYYIKEYLYYSILYLGGLGIFVYFSKYRNINDTLLAILPQIGFFPLLLWHNFGQPYYFLPVQTLILIFSFYEIMHLERRYVLGISIYIFLLMIITKVPITAFERANFWQNEYVGDGALVGEIIRTPGQGKYVFGQYYRPDYPPALDYMNKIYQSQSVNSRLVLLNNTPNVPEGFKLLCGQTFFGSQYCKWAVK